MTQNQTHRVMTPEEKTNSQIRVASYIADLLQELSAIAHKEDLLRLELVLDEARDEALRLKP